MVAFVQRGFANGEISEQLAARRDQPKTSFGARRVRNLTVLRNGALANRPGSVFITEVKDSTKAVRLLPFIFANDDSYLLEVGDTYIRWVRTAAKVGVSGPAAHDTAALYEPGDIRRTGVAGSYAHYVCLVGHAGVTPPSATYWLPLSMTTTDDSVAVGGTSVLETKTPFTEAQLFELTHAQSNDVLTLCHRSVFPYDLTRYSATRWTSLPKAFGPALRAPMQVRATRGGTAASGTGYTFRYTVTAIRKDGSQESLPGATARQESGIASRGLAAGDDIRVTTDATHGVATTERVLVTEVLCLNGTPDSTFIAQLEGRVFGISDRLDTGPFWFDLAGTSGITVPGAAGDYRIVVTALDAPCTFVDVEGGGAAPVLLSYLAPHGLQTGDLVHLVAAIEAVSGQQVSEQLRRELVARVWPVTVVDASTVSLQGSEGLVIGVAIDGYVAPVYAEITSAKQPQPPVPGDGIVQVQHTVEWDPVDDAQEYWIYKQQNGVWGYIGTAVGTVFKDEGQQPQIDKVPPQHRNPFLKADSNPAAVAYFQQRLGFAGPNSNPRRFLLSVQGDFPNFGVRSPAEAGDTVDQVIAGNQAHPIRHLAWLEHLVILTAGNEWLARGNADGVVLPDLVNLSAIGYDGSSHLPPLVTGSSLIFNTARGNQVRELRLGAAGLEPARDLTVWAPHLFDGYRLVDWCFARTPHPTIWAVRDDGVLLGGTYVPEQDIMAWHRHDTADAAGTAHVESVCAIPEGDADVVYLLVRRVVAGVSRRYIERVPDRKAGLETFDPASDGDVPFLDCAIKSTAGTDVVGGLSHLEGRDAWVRKDGVVSGPYRVSSGQIAGLGTGWSLAWIGLLITCELETLPVDSAELREPILGRRLAVPLATLLVERSRGFSAGPVADEDKQSAFSLPAEYGTTGLFTGKAPIRVEGTWEHDGSVVVRHATPLPLTLLGLVLEVKVGG